MIPYQPALKANWHNSSSPVYVVTSALQLQKEATRNSVVNALLIWLIIGVAVFAFFCGVSLLPILLGGGLNSHRDQFVLYGLGFSFGLLCVRFIPPLIRRKYPKDRLLEKYELGLVDFDEHPKEVADVVV